MPPFAGDASAAEWRVDPANSRLSVHRHPGGQAVRGIVRDNSPRRSASTRPIWPRARRSSSSTWRARRTGNAQGDDAVKGQDWFAVATLPAGALRDEVVPAPGRQSLRGRRRADHPRRGEAGGPAVHAGESGRRQRGRRANSSSTAPTSASVRANGRARNWWRTRSRSASTCWRRPSRSAAAPGDSSLVRPVRCAGCGRRALSVSR